MRKQAVIAAAVMAIAIGSVGCGAMGDGGARADASAAAGNAVENKAGFAAGLPRATGNRLTAVGLTADQRLVSFRTDRPDRTLPLGKVKGLKGDTKLVGIDYRMQNNKLYGVGDRGGIYTIREIGAKATKAGQLSVALQGRSFGVDFNPAANRLRVISDTGQNLRHNIDDPAGAPAAGTTASDGTLTNPPVPPATVGATAQGVTGAAYTNNDLSATTATTLFDVDTVGDQVSVQSPANAGNLAPTGKLGVDAGPSAGFDIYTSTQSGTNAAYGVLTVGGAQRLYRVDLLNGSVTRTGTFDGGRAVVDLAVPLRQG
ncbi:MULTISPECIES: DUF4394 domain-containing protein [Streptomyces]|uniref:DUF4394 domain-containing protein n=1 Tax=Streptomyces dengpaensis TaxID=2049881 RepID=A0ABM6T2Y9_9ACTN|nr:MULTISPECIES: DUF4394 domain-containing protein [Streptomyces]AVH61455.1 DUF4394 domain-containing protein [Streptomyces dengpaensis]PIB11413.1 hypothetical protein B1C81_04375 [Streptomyces sp. HG99]